MERVLSFFSVVVGIVMMGVLAGCSVKLEAPLLPNINLKDIPKESDKNKVPVNADNTEKSRGEATTGAKKILANIVIGDRVASDLRISTAGNCAQLVELSSGAVVVDFASNACPGTAESAQGLVFTALYEQLFDDTYRLTFQGKFIGEMEISSDGKTLTLTQLCSGGYFSSCFQGASEDRLSGAPILF